MTIDPKRVKEIFLEAAELADEAARAAYLDKACGADAALRSRVEALLRSHDTEGSFLGAPAAVLPDPAPAATEAFAGKSDPGVAAALTASGETGPSHDELTFLAPSTSPDALGRLGHYEVLQVLGRGGFGIVFRAFDEMLQRVVALKVMAPQLAATSPARKRFLREARSSAQVRHENVVQVYEVAEQPLPYLAMEFIPGETLQQKLNRLGPLEVTEVLRIGRQIAEGLAAAHATGLIHRDIKPGNVLLEGGHQKVKITDFGLARTADDASISQSGLVAGTPMYMAPEQAQGEPLDQRADLFSLGSVLYQMTSGRPPFRANSMVAVLKRVAEDTPRDIREIIPETPQWLCDIIAKLHAKDPDDRYQSAREVADVLADCEAQLQANAKLKDSSHIPRSQPLRSEPETLFRSRRWAAAAAVLLLLLGGLGFTEATGVTNFRGTVIRLFSPEGTLVIEVDDPRVSIQIDDSDIVITGAGAKEIRLKPGRYTVEARKDGKLVSRELVTITKDGRQVVRVSQEASSGPKNGSVEQAKDPDRRAAEYVLSIGGMVKVNERGRKIKAVRGLPREPFRLTMVELAQNMRVTDADLAVFKSCKNLTHLSLWQTNVGDEGLVHVKECQTVTHLWLGSTKVTDAGLAHLDGSTNLVLVDLLGTKVTDVGLAYLKGSRGLDDLSLSWTGVTDAGLAHFKDCKNLTTLWLGNTQVTDAGLAHLAGMDKLAGLDLRKTKVTAKGVEELAKALPKCEIMWDGGEIEPKAIAPFTDADVQRIAALPSAEQVEEVRKELKKRNLGFDGELTPTIENGVVTGLAFLTDQVTDIGPVRALKFLKNLRIHGSDPGTGALADLSPLKGLPLKWLNVGENKVSDLTPLKGMPLEHLYLWQWRGNDLTPLKNMPLKWLNCGGGRQELDLTPLAGLPLEYLCVNYTQVSDLTPLKDVPLTILLCSNTPVSDLTPLRGRLLKHLKVYNTKVADLSPLKGMPLARLECQGAGVTNLSPLKGMQLDDIRVTPKDITQGLDILRDMKSLKTIGIAHTQAWPAAEFWERYDKGEFK